MPIQAFVIHAPGPEQLEQFMSQLAARAAAFRDSEHARALRATDLGLLVRSGRLKLTVTHAAVLYDPPAKLQAQTSEQEGHVVSSLRQTILATRNELVFVSPYFVPNERGVGMLCELVRRGVRVRVLTTRATGPDCWPVGWR